MQYKSGKHLINLLAENHRIFMFLLYLKPR